MIVENEQLALHKNNLYRDNYRRVMSYLIVAICVGLFFLGILAYQVLKRAMPQYYATTTTGQLVPLQSLDMPVVTNPFLLQWATLATRAAYNLNFQDYPNQLKAASAYFTSDGWDSLMNALKESGILDSLKNNKLFISAVVNGPAVILDQSVVRGRYMWRVQLPLLVTYTSASDERKSSLVVTLDIVRVPVVDAAKSIQISRFSAA